MINVPLLGDRFPTMIVKTTQGTLTLPDAYAGKWFVFFIHPGDFTPVGTTEFVGFARRSEEFKALNTELIGLSVDQAIAHMKWIEWIEGNFEGVKIPFPVIADELGTVATQLGMLHEKKGTDTVRAVFIVDPEGILRLMMYYPQEIGRSVNEVLRAVKALQTADQYKVACPENWPDNALLGKDFVMVPPPKNEAAKQERQEAIKAGQMESKDWWFSYKKL
ncbi:MAG: peroxiredoxin [Clostridia bacterium]|nr:peroxiredoxin [Clostridia bacterium]